MTYERVTRDRARTCDLILILWPIDETRAWVGTRGSVKHQRFSFSSLSLPHSNPPITAMQLDIYHGGRYGEITSGGTSHLRSGSDSPPPTHARPHHRPGDVYVNGRRVGYFSGDDIYCDGQREGYFSGTVRRSHRPRPCPSRRTSPTTLLRTGPLSREPRRLLERLRGHHRHLRRRLPAGTLCPSQARERGKKWGFFSSRR